MYPKYYRDRAPCLSAKGTHGIFTRAVKKRLFEHGRFNDELFPEAQGPQGPSAESEESDIEESDFENDQYNHNYSNSIFSSGLGDIRDILGGYFPLTPQRFHTFTTTSGDLTQTFIRFVKIFEEFVFGVEILLKCIENLAIICRNCNYLGRCSI